MCPLTRNRFAAMLLVLCMSSVMAQAIDIDAAALYRFEDQADAIAVGEFLTDASGNERHAEVFGGAIDLVAGQAKLGQAGSFNANLAFRDFADVDTSGDFTFALWMKSATLAQAQVYLLSFSNGSGGGEQTAIIYQYEKNAVELYSGNSATDLRPGSQLSVPDTEWHHIVYTRSGSDYDAYLDGAKRDIATLDGPVHNPQYLSLGGTGHLRAGGPVALYEGLLDDALVMTRGVDQADVDLMMRGFTNELAYAPSPEDGTDDVLRDHVLSWEPGLYAVQHDVYLGTDFDDVNNAGIDSDFLLAQGQADTSYDAGALDFGQSYYWRVDEVNGAPDNTVFKGNVWSFTVEPFSIPVETMTATASSSNAANMGPENTINGIGLNELDQHSTEGTDMWLSGMGDPAPSIQYAFDKVYKLDQMLVWNSNQLIESFVGIGAKDVLVEHSVDGAEWTALEGATLFNQAPGAPDYTANTVVDFGGALAKHVRITVNAGYGMLPQYGLSELRFLYVPTFAREPLPVDGETSHGVDVLLGWRAGREAVSHEIHLGTDAADLALLGTTSDNSYTADTLDYDTTYYWQLLEVNEAEMPASYAGPIWSFSTPAYGIVDDFERYDDNCNRIFFAWEDGLGHNGGEDIASCDVPASNGNGGGSIVGHAMAPFAEKTIVNSGTQSMPFAYDNAFGPSEATVTLNGQNWTTSSVRTLSLAFYGAPDNTGELYVKINNTQVAYSGDPDSLAINIWHTWNIDLTALQGLDNVTLFAIGVDGADAAGMLYIDDIRLSPQAAVNEVYDDELAINAYEWVNEGFLDNTPATPGYWGSDVDMAKLIDGVIAPDYSPSEACAGWNYSTANGPFGPTLYFDLGSTQSIGAVAIFHQPRYYGFETVTVSVSALANPNRADIDDMTDWTGEEIHQSDHWGVGDSGNASSVMQTVPIGQEGRWVRLQFLNWEPGYDTAWTMFSEFEFYAE
jgi:hypothetical protein